VPRACDGYAMLGQDSKCSPWETTQLGGSPNKMAQQLETRTAQVGHGKARIELLYMGRQSRMLFAVNIGHTPAPLPNSNRCGIFRYEYLMLQFSLLTFI
jgi:hypothetical protein